MYLRDYLHDIPLKALKSIAEALDVTVEYQARIKLINAIDRAFWDKTLLEKLLKNLSEEHRQVLAVIAFSYDNGVNERALIKKIEKKNSVQKRKITDLLHDLISLALIGGIREHDNIYFCPRGIAEPVRKSFIQSELAVSSKTLPVPAPSPSNLMEDIFSLLALVYKEDVPLTLSGQIKKSVLDKAFDGSPTCGRNNGQLLEESRNAFIFEYLKNRELISFDLRKVRVTDTIYGWLELSMTERFQDVVAFALTQMFQDDSLFITVTGILAETSAGFKFTIKNVARFLHANTTSLGGIQRLETKVKEIFTILTQLGLFSHSGGGFVMTDNGARIFRNESLSLNDMISGTFIVQPNFEIIVGPELDPRVRFKLELLTSRVNRDMVTTYVVTHEGVTRARERGMSTDEVIQFFIRHSKNPLPQNVLFSIESWAKAYGSIFFEETVLMRFHDANTCRAVIHIPQIGLYVKEQLSPTVLIINHEHVKTITSVLKKAGYQPEINGSKLCENAANSIVFTPITINKLLDKNKMPEFYTDFIFPEYLLSGEEKK